MAVAKETVVPPTDSIEPHAQPVTAAPDGISAEVSAAKQRPITDFFTPCSSAPHGPDSTRRVSTRSSITPCPSVNLAEVPAAFQLQSDCIAEDYLDPTYPLFKSCLELPSLESDSSPVEVDLDIPSPKLPDAATKKGMYPELS